MSDKQTSHFWVGHASQELAEDYFAETYSEDEEETPVSAFARDQGIMWYDHDFLEHGWGTAPTIQELVAGYSYSDQWAEELAQRVAGAELTDINFFVFISEEEIEHPQSVEGDGYWLRYMGMIEYDI